MPPRPAAFGPRYRWYVLAILVVMNVFAFVDRGIVGTLGQAMKDDLRLSDTQLGLLGGLGFAIFYGLFGIPIARLADRANRSVILSCAVAFWSVMTAACGLAQTFWQLLAARVGVGIGEAGSTIAHPLISDLFPPERRATALGIFALGSPGGIIVGTMIAAWIAEHFGWRAGFTVVGLPGVALALLILTTVKDVPRGFSEGKVSEAAGFGETFGYLFRKRSFVHLIAAVSIFGIGMVAAGAFVQPFLVRHFELTYTAAAFVYAASFGAGSAIGVFSGGYLADRLARRDERFYAWLPGVGVIVCGVMLTLAYLQNEPTIAIGSFVAAIIGSGWYMAPSWAMAQNLARPSMRATAAALIVFTINVFASAIGPALVGMMSDLIATRAYAGIFAIDCPGGRAAAGAAADVVRACAGASSKGLQTALLIVNVTFFWGAAHYFLAARTVCQDMEDGAPAPPVSEVGGVPFSVTADSKGPA
jgi:predicted MFS family arabinose efflux permease